MSLGFLRKQILKQYFSNFISFFISKLFGKIISDRSYVKKKNYTKKIKSSHKHQLRGYISYFILKDATYQLISP